MTKEQIDFFLLMGMIVGREFSSFEEFQSTPKYAEIIQANVDNKPVFVEMTAGLKGTSKVN